MGIRMIVAALVLLLFASGCKKDEANKEEVGEKLAEVLTVLSGASAVYDENFVNPEDSIDALDAMGQWIIDQDAVEEAYYVGINSVEITFKNGLRSSILLTEVDANGQHLTRGGGYGSSLTAFKTTAAREKIKNEKVLVLNPFINEFYFGSYNKASNFRLDGQPMEVDVFNGSEVGFAQLNSMDDYGLTIFNTHGLTYGFFLYKLFDQPQNPEIKNWGKIEALALLDQAGAVDIDKVANGEVELALNLQFEAEFGVTVKQVIGMVVTTKYIRNSGMDLTDAVVYGNFCYSGYTYEGSGFHNMSEAFRSLNAATYYGYAFETGFSIPVENEYAKRMEDSIIANLANRADTTGAAHLANNITRQFDLTYVASNLKDKVVKGRAVRLTATSGTPNNNQFPFYFNQYFDGNYTYRDCIDSMIDPRDSAVYYTVCIGSRVWMAENLNYFVPGSLCMDSLAAKCDTFGRLYSRDEVFNGQQPQVAPDMYVQGICPQGWHIPSADDWADLEIALGVFPTEANDLTNNKHGEDIEAGTKLLSASGWAPYSGTDGPTAGLRNQSGFNALPGGSWTNTTLTPFSPAGELAYFWSSTWMPSQQEVMLRRLRYRFRGIYVWDDVFTPGVLTRYSCRCVQDPE